MRCRSLIGLLVLSAASIAAAQPSGNPLSPQPAKAGLPAPTVTLKSPGAEPRQALRIKPVVGSKQSVELVIAMTQETTMSGTATPKSTIPAITMPMAIEVTGVAADGDVSYTAVIGKPTVAGDGEMAQMMNQSLGGLENGKATVVVSSRGVTRDASFRLAEGAGPELAGTADQMNQSMKQFSVPFPEEPVGLGAVWTVEVGTDMAGVTATAVATYTLKEIADGGCTLDVSLTQTAPKQEVKNPDIPPGMTVTLESITGEGRGTSHVRFDRPMPTDAKVDITTRQDVSMAQNGRTQSLKQVMEMNMTIRDTGAGAKPGNPLSK